MMSLLGPVLNISPVIPALGIFSLLGVATLDNFSFQGRGSTLLLDWFASFSAEHRDRVVRHEAGHFLVAHLLGIPITGYTLTAWEAFQQGQTGRGGVSFDCQELDAQVEQGAISAQLVDRYCKVWMAGIAAETLIYGKSEGGADDREKFGILWAQLHRPEAEGLQKLNWSAFQAKTLIQSHWSAYEALVAAMQKRAAVLECCDAIERTSSVSQAQ
nr:ATP-dependent Zn protease [Oculatella sp. LEGE 06141]